jgi:hypothetical protein
MSGAKASRASRPRSRSLGHDVVGLHNQRPVLAATTAVGERHGATDRRDGEVAGQHASDARTSTKRRTGFPSEAGPMDRMRCGCVGGPHAPIKSGGQRSTGVGILRYEAAPMPLLTWRDWHTSWSIGGAGDGNRIGMASLEGWKL